tara:strand:- start:11554 stop:11940 length:387 start_codon:yes stop_codon:yes gene_type:complete
MDNYEIQENQSVETTKVNKHPYRYIMKMNYNDDAKEVIKALRKLGKRGGFRVQVRGSGSRVPEKRADGLDLRRYDQSLPLEYAEQVRVYLNDTKGRPLESVAHNTGVVEGAMILQGYIGLDWQSKPKY